MSDLPVYTAAPQATAAPASAPIEVLAVRPVENAGNLRALASVRIGCLKIHGWRVIQQPGQRAYVSVPQQQSRDGRWYPLIEARDSDLLAVVRQAVLGAWEAQDGRAA